MPNHVYNWISVEEKYAEKIEEIAKVGLAQYYKPMPKELEKTTFPDETMTKKRSDHLIKLYGHNNWYEWAIDNWGTKWGCYDNEYDKVDMYTYTTAWSPLDMELLDMLAKDIPTFCFGWEEEQGFGQEWEYKNGFSRLDLEWDLPEWKETDVEGVCYLSEAYENPEGKYEVGYYCEYSLNEWLAYDFDNAVKEYKSLTITEV
jgi:hypothetical protein